MLLHVPTLAIVAGCISLGFALCLPLSWRLARAVPGLRCLTLGMAIAGLSLFLLPVYDLPLPRITLFVASVLLVLSSVLSWYGLRVMLLPGRPPVLPLVTLMIGHPALVLYFSVLSPFVQMRLVVNSLTLAGMAVAIVIVLIRARQTSPAVLWVMAGTQGIHAGFLLTRMVLMMQENTLQPYPVPYSLIDRLLFLEVVLLLFITALCTVMIVAERLQRELTHQARTDPLTNTLNRRGFQELAERELLKAARSARPLGVLVADIDHFKRLNDTYGHAAGDMVLQYFCALLNRALRQTDILARLGGEEFVIVLPETPPSEVMDVAERLRRTVQDTPMTFRDFLIPITVSIGVAYYPQSSDTLEGLQACADSALYRAKKSGRNCVSDQPLASEPHSVPIPRDDQVAVTP
ncbi:GGDEF domain-containing protein [Novispirillum itersonii]|uniref:GGDEF domain-containing protein n=1 Tax=Novispirillum itersonii TaxID=189 RepID=UPI0003677A75|nr:GGDEF domain-containing protein [Novispirillum itersonii]